MQFVNKSGEFKAINTDRNVSINAEYIQMKSPEQTVSSHY